MVSKNWPLFDLRITTPRVELRLLTDDDLELLAEVALAGVHSPDMQPFNVAWAMRDPEELRKGLVQYQWQQRANFSAARWRFELGTWVDGELIGSQGLMADNFSELKLVSSGSWLGQQFQGQGFGVEMRQAILHFAFDSIGAEVAETEAREENAASIAVTEKCGYLPNGETRVLMGGTEPARLLRYRLPRDVWEQHRRSDIEVTGYEACKDYF